MQYQVPVDVLCANAADADKVFAVKANVERVQAIIRGGRSVWNACVNVFMGEQCRLTYPLLHARGIQILLRHHHPIRRPRRLLQPCPTTMRLRP